MKGGKELEQLNIEGKRSGSGFIAHKATLINALSRALSARVELIGLTFERKGLLNYLKSLSGSNTVKVVPANGDASGLQVANGKALKVVCGSNTSYLVDKRWLREATTKGKSLKGGTPYTTCEVRISPHNTVMPNIGTVELGEALNRVLPFTAKDDARPILQCVNFIAKDGKLTLVSADGFRLAVNTLDFEGEGQALIPSEELRSIASALRKAKRARLTFIEGDASKPASLALDTELIGYKWQSVEGSFPKWENLIPTENTSSAHFDTVEALKALRTLKALDGSKGYSIDVELASGKLTLANTDNLGQADVPAETEGDCFTRLSGNYFAEVLKACGTMVDLRLASPTKPLLFSSNGYSVVVMPMISTKAQDWQKAHQASAPSEAVAEVPSQVVAEAESVASQAEAVASEPKRNRKGKSKREAQAQADVVAEAEDIVEAEAVAVA